MTSPAVQRGEIRLIRAEEEEDEGSERWRAAGGITCIDLKGRVVAGVVWAWGSGKVRLG